LCQKIATSVRCCGAPTAGCLQEIDQFLDVDPIADEILSNVVYGELGASR
jgi:hypothetical protein